VKIYTIGVGNAKPMQDAVPYLDERGHVIDYGLVAPIDADALKNVAAKTGGKFYMATSSTALSEIFAEINKLEKTEFDVRNFLAHRGRLYAVGMVGFRTVCAATAPVAHRGPLHTLK